MAFIGFCNLALVSLYLLDNDMHSVNLFSHYLYQVHNRLLAPALTSLRDQRRLEVQLRTSSSKERDCPDVSKVGALKVAEAAAISCI